MMSLSSRLRRAALVLVAGFAGIGHADAHKASDAYLHLVVRDAEITQRIDIALRDLDRELVIDSDEDGQLTWGEVRQRWPQIEQLAQAHLVLQADGRPCRPGAAGAAQLDTHSDGRYAVLTRHWTCPGPVRELGVGYTLFAGSDPTHRAILRLTQQGQERTAILVPGAGAQRFGSPGAGGGDGNGASDSPASPSTFAGFVKEGVHHILIGTDHVLFLLALLLPAVLVPGLLRPPPGRLATARRPPAAQHLRSSMARTSLFGLEAALPHLPAQERSATLAALATPASPWTRRLSEAAWRPAPAVGPVLLGVTKVVTAFTLAHSITLALAILGWVNPPSRVVESVIAATVALAAIDNLYPFLPRERWKLTFVFGLAHGFGFAGALQDLGLVRSALASSLLGFNLGVEIGQLAIVALFLPLAWWGRGSAFYRRVVLGAGSALIVLLSLVWLVERAFDLQLLG